MNGRQKRLRANTIVENIINDTHCATLRELVPRAISKKLKTKDKNSNNTKIQQGKIQRDRTKRSHIVVTKKSSRGWHFLIFYNFEKVDQQNGNAEWRNRKVKQRIEMTIGR